jgi:hypothetical protein
MTSARIVLRRIVPVWVSRVKNPTAARFAFYPLVAALMMLAGSILIPAASADQLQLDASLTWHAGGTACAACSLTFDVSLIFDNVTGQIMPGTLSEQVIGPVGPATLTPLAPMNTFSAATGPHCGFGAHNGLGDGVEIDFYESLGFCQHPIQTGNYTFMAAFLDCISTACNQDLGGGGGFQRPDQGFITVSQVGEPGPALLLMAGWLPMVAFAKRRLAGRKRRPE